MGKKRTVKQDGFDFENSTLFGKSGREKNTDGNAAAAKSRRLKTATTVFAAVIVLIIAVPLIIIAIAGKHNSDIINDGQPKHSYEELLEHTEATEHSKALFNMKNPELSDAEAVSALISYLKSEERLGSYSVEIQSTEKPYSVTFKFDLTHDVGAEGEDEWELGMIKYSCAVMALADNVAQVNWEYPIEGGKTDGSFFNRGDADKLMNLGIPIERFAESDVAIQLLLNQLGIDIY